MARRAAHLVAFRGNPQAGRGGRKAKRWAALLAVTLSTCAQPAYARSRLGTLEDVNWQVNHLGLVDCKSAAFEKARRLERKGIRAVFVAVRIETGEYHAIAVVDGIWALDSRQRDVVTIGQLRRDGYQIAHIPGEP